MDEVMDYDDDGIPVINHSKRKQRLKESRQYSPGASPGNSNPGSAHNSTPGTPQSPACLSALFDIDGKTCDVMLDRTHLAWNPISTASTSRSKKNRNFFKRLKSQSSLAKEMGEEEAVSDAMYSIPLKNVIGASIRRGKQSHLSAPGSNLGPCEGIVVYTYDHKTANRYKERTIFLPHPNDDVCLTWVNRIQTYLKQYTNRPKTVKIFLQPWAGKKMARAIYRKSVQPVFESAGIDINLTELQHNEHIKEEMTHIELNNFDCLVVIGGDGSVHRLINALLNLSQKINKVDVRQNFAPASSPIPIGIIPAGTTNQIVHSVQGVDDVETAAMHILLGNQQMVDVCSVFSNDSLYGWSLLSHYGFFGNMLSLITRYVKLGEKRLEAAALKALTKSKFQPYECELQYIPAPELCGHPGDGRVCSKKCVHCGHSDNRTADESMKYSDDVIELDPLNMSSTSSTIMDMTTAEEENSYKFFKGALFSLSLLSIPGHSEMAPYGMNKFTHLHDGCIDVVLVKYSSKKDFVRYLRRHGNQKDQGDYSFVERLRCREVKVNVRQSATWKHRDLTYNEINDEMERQNKVAANCNDLEGPVEVINDLEDSSVDDEDEDLPSSPEQTPVKNKRSGSLFVTSTANNAAEKQGRTNRANSVLDIGRDGAYKSDTYRPTWLEMETARRAKDARKQEKKKIERDVKQMTGIWNLDNEICGEVNLHFRPHSGLLCIYGQGVTPEYRPDEVDVRFPCLALM